MKIFTTSEHHDIDEGAINMYNHPNQDEFESIDNSIYDEIAANKSIKDLSCTIIWQVKFCKRIRELCQVLETT